MASNASRLLLGGFYDTILVKYVGEIGIKSERVRRRLKDRLAKCIENQLERKRAHGFSLSVTHARLFLSIKDPGDVEAVHELLKRIPGIHSFSYCSVIPLDLAQLHDRAVALSRLALREGMSFAVRVAREGTHEFTSQSLARDVGSSIYETFKDLHIRVDLTSPDVTVYIEVRDDTALLYHEKHDGFGGMPRDVSSPVLGCVGLVPASWDACQRMIKRGSNLHPVLLRRMLPAPSEASRVEDIADVLNADPEIVEQIFGLLDMQEDNRVRVTVVPISDELAGFLEKERVPIDSRTTATFLGIAVPALIHARIYVGSAGVPRKAIDFKAIVSEYSGGPEVSGTARGLRWIQATSAVIAAMMPAGVPALPLLFPLMPGGIANEGRTSFTAGDNVVASTDGAMLELLGKNAKSEALLSILQRGIDQRRAVQFDMIDRRFLSRG
jgi:hypothetical protein